MIPDAPPIPDAARLPDAPPYIPTIDAAAVVYGYGLLVCEGAPQFPDAGGGGPIFDAGPAADAGAIADASPPDASPPDASTVDASSIDAGSADEADAAPSSGGGDPTGILCCNPNGRCPDGFQCIQQGTAQPTCRPGGPGNDCLITGTCPAGSSCVDFGPMFGGTCVAGQHLGDVCAPEVCDDLTLCVGTSDDVATCHLKCTTNDDCAEGENCVVISGAVTGMACI